MPGLANDWYPPSRDTGRLRVTANGHRILDQLVKFRRRSGDTIFIGLNAIGGSAAPTFTGEIRSSTGRVLRGSMPNLFSKADHAQVFWRRRHWEILISALLVLLAAGVGRVIARTVGVNPRTAFRWTGLPIATRRRHTFFAVLAALSLLLFIDVETGGTFRLTYPVSFGTFFDYQAGSLLQGHLDVPEAAISGEAFIIHGKFYGYFGLTPSLLRLPLVAADVGFGQLSRWYMAAYFAAAMLAAYGILRQTTRMARGADAEPSYWAIALITFGAGAGSTLFFLGSRAYIYHEATLCGATFALWSAYYTLRWLREPACRCWLGALIFGLFSVHARPPSGLFALSLVGVVAAYLLLGSLWRRQFATSARFTLVGVAAVAAVLSFNGMSYLKFGTFDGSPLKYSVQFDAQRLAHIEGKNFHLVNVRRNIDEYVLAPNFHFDPLFPYFFFDARVPRSYPEAKIDIGESTVGFPYAMTGLVGAWLLGGAWALIRFSRLRTTLGLLFVAVAPMALALFAAIATAHRHTADFCPFLVTSAACGIAALDASRRRAAWLALLSVFALWSVFVALALSLQFQGERVWGSPPETVARFQHLRQVFDATLLHKKP
jgi:hypothetical protein